MATVTWIGAQGDTPGKKVWTVTAGAGTTFTAAQNNKKAIYGPTAAETATEIAAGIVTAVQSSTFGELQEISSITSSAAVITAYGPSDGGSWTFDITASGGAGSISAATVTNPTSSHDAADVLNYSGGALPVNGDTLIYENSTVSVLYGLTALTAITLAKLWRKATYAGSIGLPKQSVRGYQEFRTRYLETSASVVQIDCVPEDTGVNGEAKFFLRDTLATTATWVVTSPVPNQLGSELVDCYGHGGSSVLDVSGAGVRVANLAGQTSTLTSVLANNCSLILGPGCTLTTLNFAGTNAIVHPNYATLTLNQGGTVNVRDSATASGDTRIQNGTVLWQSIGNVAALIVESDGVFDAGQAPAAFTIASVSLVGDNWSFLDPNKRVTRGTLVFTLSGGSFPSGTFETGTGTSVTLLT